MYSTGFTQRSGHYSNVYQKAGFESNMPSIHSAVPGTYGPNYRPSAGWGNTNSPFQGHSHVKQNSADFFDGTNGFKKSQSEYMAESCWEGTTPDQTVCYGECKRSGRMCASCVQYMQSNYGVQKMTGRCQTQMLQAHTYPQRHPSWHGANALPHRVQTSHNGYPLQRSNSEPTGYGFHDNYNAPHNQGSCHSPWGAKSQAVDVTRRTSTWYQNGFHPNPSQTHGYNTDNNVPFKATSCEVANQRYKMQMRSSSTTSVPMVSPERDSIMPRAQTRFSSSQWNTPVAMPSMPNTCVSVNGSPAQGNQSHRSESLQYHHACAFPPTPPAEPHYAMATSNKVGNNSSCQLPQMVPNPTIMNSPNQPSRADTAYWNGPSSVNNPAVDGISKYQYCSQTNVVTSIGTTISSPNSSLQSQTTVNSSVSSACPTVPSSCDLSDKAWQNGIIDINTTGCDVNDKARIFSAELEKLAKLSQNFDNDEFEFTNVSTNTTILSPSATTLSSEGAACTNVVTSIGPTEKMTCFETPKYSPRPSEFTSVGQCLSTAPEANASSCVRGNNPTEKESQQSSDKAPELDNNVTTSTSDGQVDDLGKLKTKHTDYLDQTSDVNPYGSQNCIAALSASCRKMIADMDKPEKVPSTEQMAAQKQTSPSQQSNSNVNNFIDNTNGVTNCFNGTYGPSSMQHQHQHHHTHSFPVDPYTLHYAQHPMPNQHGSVDKCRRARKRKSIVGRGSSSLNNGRQFEHSDLTKKSANMMTQHSHHENLGKDLDQSRSPPPNNSSDSDLRNISPTFSDGPVSFDILDSVFSPENSLNTSTNELSTILEGPNQNANFPLCNTFSDYETVMPSAGGSHCSSSPGVLPAPPTPLSAPTPSSQERHPLEILQDQIKIQRQQFSLDRPSEKLPEPNNNNTPNADPILEKTPVHSDVNENHVIESIQ